MMGTVAAILFCIVTAGLAVFQLLLVSGAPFGHMAWGGQHKRLPVSLRIASVASVFIYGGLAAVILSRAGLLPLWQEADWLTPASWAITGFFGLGVLLNLASRSLPERLIMTPVAAALCLSAAFVAMRP